MGPFHGYGISTTTAASADKGATSAGVQPPPPSAIRRVSSRPVWYTISDLAREFEVTLRALRFYEARGLLNPIRQNANRLYSPRDRIKLQLILTGKRLGFTLGEIAEMIAENDDSAAPSLKLDREKILRQISFLEEQYRTTEAALAELRRHYYLMSELAEPRADQTAVGFDSR